MKERILLFLQTENKSYAQFAEEIGVQPSGISHILSGRNNPSLDFVIKMLQKYSALSAEWLLFGNGNMFKSVSQPTLFDEIEAHDRSENINIVTTEENSAPGRIPEEIVNEVSTVSSMPSEQKIKSLTHIVMFYSDKTFTEYSPGK